MPAVALENRLLAALPITDFARWSPHLEAIELKRGDALAGPGAAQGDAYFPVTAVVSLRQRLRGGGWAESASIGREGVVALAVVMGDAAPIGNAIVRTGGLAFRIDSRWLQQECAHQDRPRSILLRYARALINEASQTAICNRHHTLAQQVCRRLLWFLDRVGGNDFAITHEELAGMIGVRRSGVTELALLLQGDGVIRYRRGSITVLDRDALEQRSCECHASIEREYDRLLYAAAGV